MKPTQDHRRELMEDVFAPENARDAMPFESVLRAVQAAKRARRLRQRAIGCVAALLAFMWGVTRLLPNPPSNSPTRATQSVAAAPSPANPPSVERVDDDGMLAMLDGQPAAVVRWPDGRKSLLLLVSRPAAR
jgi:hypothetical protein